ncbi:MAG TPA: mycothiol synthase [Acidimicrobiales bacterium]|nr:mycothiol synthase [Acidimicrobiales bacterium]
MAVVEIDRGPDLSGSDLQAEVDRIRAAGDTPRWWVHGARPEHRDLAAALGLAPVRSLFQMRRPLPLEETTDLVTRPYRPGVDDEAWLAVNNRAFAWHPDQGGWTAAVLAGRRAEPWFDPEGFLLHERDGRLAGFCWTKVHPATDVDPPLGEIYVIAVDPDFVGLGLGRALTVAGLQHLAGRGLEVGMLYVESDNAPAVGLYEALGFHVHQTDTAFEPADA